MIKTCEWHECSKEFETNLNAKKFCCPECKAKHDHWKISEERKKSKLKSKGYTKTCQNPECGKTFQAKHYNQDYCCVKCRSEARKIRDSKIKPRFEIGKKVTTLDSVLAEAKALGISYSEYKKRLAIEKYARVDV